MRTLSLNPPWSFKHIPHCFHYIWVISLVTLNGVKQLAPIHSIVKNIQQKVMAHREP